MSDILSRKFECDGCGIERKCTLSINQESIGSSLYQTIDNLKCVLDETNQTSYNWVELNEVKNKDLTSDDTTKKVLP